MNGIYSTSQSCAGTLVRNMFTYLQHLLSIHRCEKLNYIYPVLENLKFPANKLQSLEAQVGWICLLLIPLILRVGNIRLKSFRQLLMEAISSIKNTIVNVIEKNLSAFQVSPGQSKKQQKSLVKKSMLESLNAVLFS